jgi:hypothetical protein
MDTNGVITSSTLQQEVLITMVSTSLKWIILDLYAGPALGYRVASSSYDGLSGYDAYGNGVFFGVFAGGKILLQAEHGRFCGGWLQCSSLLKLGIAFKF